MKEMEGKKIIAFIGVYGSVIMANTSEGYLFPWLWISTTICWTVRYIYLTL